MAKKKRVSLDPALEAVLREQRIDENGPGTILRDFGAVLGYVAAHELRPTGTHDLLPIASLGPLDELLSRPLRLGLERPQLKSHPYLQGLHLLLRATGVVSVERQGKKAKFVVLPEVRAAWEGLNHTERYFTLLEAWLLHAQSEMIGERGDGLSGELDRCVGAWRWLPARGHKLDLSRPQYARIPGLFRRYHILALMGLFGLVEVTFPPALVLPWRPARVGHLPFGDALLTLLDEQEEDMYFEEAPPFGHWQKLLQPYFPDWKANLALPEPERHDGTYVFRLTYGRMWQAAGDMWRLLAISSKDTVDDLVTLVLNSIDFDFDHLYEVSCRDRFGATAKYTHPDCDDGAPADTVKLRDVGVVPGQKLCLWYDFGDDWRFDLTLERIEPGKPKGKPRVLEAHGEAPVQYPGLEEEWEDEDTEEGEG